MSRTTAILYSDLGKSNKGRIVHRFGGFDGFDKAYCGKKPTADWWFGLASDDFAIKDFCDDCFPRDFVLLEGERISRP